MKKIKTIYIFLFNIIGIIISFCYGVFADSGGEKSTVGAFKIISITGIITIILSIIFAFNLELLKKNWEWLLVFIIIGFLEASLINWFVLF